MSFGVSLTRIGRTPFSSFNRYGCRLVPTKANRSIKRTAFPWIRAYSVNVSLMVQMVQDAVSLRDLTQIHRSYTALVDHVERVKGSEDLNALPLLNQQHLIDIVVALGSSGRSFDLALIERILSDISAVFGLEQTEELHATIVKSLVKCENTPTVYQWLISLPQKPGHYTPAIEHWHLFLEHCSKTGDIDMIRRSIGTMHHSGCKATNETYRILIRALFERSPRPSIFRPVINNMLRACLPYDHSISSLFYDGFADLKLLRHAEEVKDLYESRYRVVPSKWDIGSDRNELLSREVQKHGMKAAVKLCEELQKGGFLVTPFTLTVLLRNSKHVDDLRLIEEKFNVRARVTHWSILINNCVRSGDLSTALSIYARCKESRIRPDTPMVHPIISALCQTVSQPPSEADIDQALDIYRDLVKATAECPQYTMKKSNTTGRWSTKKITRSPRHSFGPDANIYHSLLRALAASSNVTKYSSTTTVLMEDMQSYNIAMDSVTTTSLTVLLFRSSSSFSEAFKVYRSMVKRTHEHMIDVKGYAAILNAYARLPFGVPSLRFYFEIVKDMRGAGHEITVEVYTILLQRLGHLATQVAREKSRSNDVHYHIVAAIRRTHDLLTLDASLSPDTALWNQLMDTYQRAGCFGEAYRVWDVLYVAGTFDQTSVSIILDACGFAGAWDTAARISLKLLDIGFKFNLRNWNTWIECLCRMGRLNDAVKTVCLEMGGSQNDVVPDKESIRILLKFSKASDKENEVRSRIMRYLPDLWERLPREMQDGYV